MSFSKINALIHRYNNRLCLFFRLSVLYNTFCYKQVNNHDVTDIFFMFKKNLFCEGIGTYQYKGCDVTMNVVLVVKICG